MTSPNEPGWYPDLAPGEGWRYWNGRHWTQHTSSARPMSGAAVQPAAENTDDHPAAAQSSKSKRVVVLSIVVVLVLGGAMGIAVWLGTPGANVADKPLASVQWSRIPHDHNVFAQAGSDAMMTSVAVGQDGLVAVGSVWNSDKHDYAAAVWTSDDGSGWERIPHDDATFGTPGDGSNMWSVTAGGPGFVAVGADHLGTGRGSVGAVWTSTDGTDWQRVSHSDVFGRQHDDVTMRAVTAGGPGLVAVGHTKHSAVVWTSKDGTTWTRAKHQDSGFEPPGHSSMQTVTTGGPGLVAGGFEELPGYGQVAALWTSKDGSTWTRVHHRDATFGKIGGDTEVRSVVARGERLVAVGHAEDASNVYAVVWTSEDGETWTRLPRNEAVFGKPEHYTTMTEVLAAKRGFITVGAGRDTEHDEVHAAVWTSKDGKRWQRIRRDDAFGERRSESSEIWSVVTTGQKLVAVGATREYGQNGNAGAAWVGE